MQDIHTITSPRVFGDRRLRPHTHHQNHHQALKCPRCDSLNTKFCYYNNYNLSQPRHFCKSCRRYWTKGGVLRNVPVGGGCRKSKRSAKPKPAPSRPPNSRSSSESSTTTVTNTTIGDDGTATGLEASNHCRLSSRADNVVCAAAGGGGFRISEPGKYGVTGLETLIESTTTSQMMFPAADQIGGFMNLMSNSTAQADPLGLTGCDDVATTTTATTTTASFNQIIQSQAGVSDWIDPTVRIDDYLQNRASNGGLAALDWQMGQGGTQQQSMLFDLPSSLDHHNHHQGFWSHQTTSSHHHYDNHHQQQQWSDSNNDQILFLP